MNIAVLIKQVPLVEEMVIGPDGRLQREGIDLEMNAYCRRAVAKGVELAQATGGRCTVFSLGPPAAEDIVREAVAWGADEGVLITDPAFAGSDTLATARALAAALRLRGPFDLILAGRNSIDADTGQVGPGVAELLDLPFIANVRELTLADGGILARSELDDGWRTIQSDLPAAVSVAERLTQPCKVPPDRRAAVPSVRIRRLTADDLGSGPWGADGSPTVVGRLRRVEISRRGRLLRGGVAAQVDEALRLLSDWGALAAEQSAAAWSDSAGPPPPAADEAAGEAGLPARPTGPVVAVVIEPGRPRLARELLGEAADLASKLRGQVVAIGQDLDDRELFAWGAASAVRLPPGLLEEDVARALSDWCTADQPWALLAPGTLWGREVAARLAVRLNVGLTGDAVAFDVEDGRLVGWKPALGGQLVAAITTRSALQLATVRPGVLPLRDPRPQPGRAVIRSLSVEPRGRLAILATDSAGDVGALAAARVVVAVGMGVAPEDYPLLDPLLEITRASLAASRKVTDRGWLPRGRQIGITGHSLQPDLYIAVGIAGTFNHMVGARSAKTILAINNDPSAPVFDWSDIGLVADWREVVPLLVSGISARGAPDVAAVAGASPAV
jgi:electron transfer flavoprotein alpha subunit